MKLNISKLTRYIIENVDLIEYLTAHEGLTFKKYGNNLRAVCPLHDDKDPSFCVTISRRHVWHCFGCKDGGSLITFIERKYEYNRPQAINQIAVTTGLNMSDFMIDDGVDERGYNLLSDAQKYFMSQVQNQRYIDYFVKKGYNISDVMAQGVGYCSSSAELVRHLLYCGYDEKLLWQYRFEDGRFDDAVVFPVKDYYGTLRYFKCRLLSGDVKNISGDHSIPTYDDSLLYGIHTIQSNQPLILVEGDSDYLALHINKHNALCMGGLKITDDLINILLMYEIDTVYLWTDGDQAGWNFINRCMESYGEVFVSKGINCSVIYEKGHDPDELVLSGFNVKYAIDNAKLLPIHYINEHIDQRVTSYHFVDKILKYTKSYDNFNRDIVINHLASVSLTHPESIKDRFYTIMDDSFCNVETEKYVISAILSDSTINVKYSLHEHLFLTKSASTIYSVFIKSGYDTINTRQLLPEWLLPYFDALPVVNPDQIGTYVIELVNLYNKRQMRYMAKKLLVSTDDYESDMVTLSSLISNFYRNHTSQDQDFYSSVMGIIDRLVNQQVKRGLPIGPGWEKTDHILLGLLPKLIMILGNTGHGKTNILLNWIHNLSVMSPYKGVLFTGEMGHEEISARLLSINTGINSANININNVMDSDIQRLMDLSTRMSEKRLFISEEMNYSGIISYAEYLKAKYNISYIGIDYIQLITPSKAQSKMSKTEQLRDMSGGFKKLSTKLDIPVIVIGQLSDEALDDAIPTIRKSSESKLMTHDADVGIAMRKKNKKEKELDPNGDILFHIDKVRYNIDKQLFNLSFDPSTLRIKES